MQHAAPGVGYDEAVGVILALGDPDACSASAAACSTFLLSAAQNASQTPEQSEGRPAISNTLALEVAFEQRHGAGERLGRLRVVAE